MRTSPASRSSGSSTSTPTSTFLIDRLPHFKVPRYVEFAAELPKTPTQKVHEHLLRQSGAGAGVWDREAAGIVLRRGDA